MNRKQVTKRTKDIMIVARLFYLQDKYLSDRSVIKRAFNHWNKVKG